MTTSLGDFLNNPPPANTEGEDKAIDPSDYESLMENGSINPSVRLTGIQHLLSMLSDSVGTCFCHHSDGVPMDSDRQVCLCWLKSDVDFLIQTLNRRGM